MSSLEFIAWNDFDSFDEDLPSHFGRRLYQSHYTLIEELYNERLIYRKHYLSNAKDIFKVTPDHRIA